MKSNLNNAQVLKALLVDFLIKESLIKDCLYGSELFYGSKQRQADFIAVNGHITAFEIKSLSDDFRRFREQMDDYKKVFDFHYLVTTRLHEKKAKDYLKYNEGLILINDDLTFVIKRKPKQIHRLDKLEILQTIPNVFLRKHFKVPNVYYSAFRTRGYLVKYPLKELQDALKEYLKQKLSDRNKLFYSEKGEFTHFEDIRLLSTNLKALL